MKVAGAAAELMVSGTGSGVPILLLHEGLGSVAMWKDFPSLLAKWTGRRVLAWSRLGYGNSGDFRGPYGRDFMHREAEATALLIEELSLPRVHVFGHSDGASIALLFAARHPEKVVSLTLEAPHVFVEEVCLQAIGELARSAKSGALLQGLSKYHRNATAVFAQWYAIWSDPTFTTWNIEREIEGVSVPTLLIQGEDDEFGTFAQLDSIAARLLMTHQVRLKNCRHSPHRDQTQAVLAATAQFLGELVDA